MSKLAATMVGVGSTGAVGIYGAHSLGAFGGSESKGTGNKEYNGWEMGEVQDELKTNISSCLGKIFQNGTKASNISTVSSVKNIPGNGASVVKGCLVYNWEKKDKDNNGAGSNLRLIGTLSKGDSGVAVYLKATVKNRTSMEFEGFSYVFEKKDGKWQAVKQLGLKGESKIILSSDKGKTTFPKMEQTYFVKKLARGEYWGFLNDQGNQVRDLGESNVPPNSQWWEFTSKDGGTYPLKKGSSNFEVWWEHFFGKNRLDMGALMENTQGEWSS